jgi:hypothetical protein
MRVTALVSLLALLLTSVACGGPKVDLKQGLQVNDVATGWFDAGITDGKNKLVPTVSFKLKNLSDQKLSTLQVNALFRRVSEKDEWGSEFMTAAGSSGLAPGAETAKLTLKCPRGYTGTEPRQDMLKNRQFVDAKVELFAKYGSGQWTRLGEYQVARELLTQ